MVHRSAILRQLGPISVRRFMRDYWQRKPCLIRAAFPQFDPPVDRARLFEMARDPQVESRLISSNNQQWTVKAGPLARMPSKSQSRWTLLVQGVDLHDDATRELLSRFRFVADARLDDLMISYATDGGGVGPHVDSYDVFLLQAAGQRRWRVSNQNNLRGSDASPLRHVAGFRASEEWVLEPGDMLYLPPGIPHEGVAVGECVTYSIGFRAPEYQQLLEPWLTDSAEHRWMRGRYADARVAVAARPAALSPAMVRDVHAKLAQHRPGRADTERFLLRHLSEPKATVIFDPPARPLSATKFRSLALSRGIKLDRKTRMLHSRTAVSINGEWTASSPNAIAALRKLADRRELAATSTKRLPESTWKLLHGWHAAGWITLGS